MKKSRYTIYGLDYLSMGYILYLFGFDLTQFICILFHSGYLLCIIAQRKQLEFTLPATVSKVIIPFAITTILLNKGFLVLKSAQKFYQAFLQDVRYRNLPCIIQLPRIMCMYIQLIFPMPRFICDIYFAIITKAWLE